MKRELNVFLTAIMFYTRLPCPGWVGHEDSLLNQSTRYLPVVGWVVGCIAAFTFLAGNILFGPSLGILLSMVTSVITTGAFHEDGFADTCDGFGGGWTKERILEIMKDSRVGTYGVVGLILLLGTKFLSLQPLVSLSTSQPLVLILLFVMAHSLSRFVACTFIFTHPYVRLSESKVKPVAQAVERYNLYIGATFALVPLLALSVATLKPALLLLLFPLFVLKLYLGNYFSKWIGGYTGDCLGATQQVSEVLIYLTSILLWKFT
ncbi:adenosylcobinamide-GDP ribazoletransferase [Pontibacter silvestris]|uniref:Adenosylcobinamide-GDP ribazoletransferase n=1 Tax=Pontibacter silvestris TaxID=2305183 RepID=A0ABW4X222_9BACT|nr:adenosylcobinamide-GDP ribazoletransferase [Pontibacter silvestris]MCC9138206.1 adenosylcobinamide-GDP ribazoletransferase [Pontibacter silvestris]